MTHPSTDAPQTTTWQAIAGPEGPPLSERLARALQAHAAAEADSLSAYERLADLPGDAVTAFLMRLVVADEQRHHQLLERMVTSLGETLEWAVGPDGRHPEPPEAARVDEAIVTTRALIREEREGARHLRHLARQDRELYSGIYALLLETMALDSEKHERILRFLLRRLEGQP